MIESIISQNLKLFKLEAKDSLRTFRSKLSNFFYAILVVLMVLIAFVLGRISHFLEEEPVFSVESFESKYKESVEQILGSSPHTETIVASKGGKKYYFIWCKGSQNIKEANKRYFKTEEEAKKAGYTLAGSCK